jgi:hypothetical protein
VVLNQQNRNNFPFSAYEESTMSEATSEVDLVRGFLRFHLSHGKKATVLTYNPTEMSLKIRAGNWVHSRIQRILQYLLHKL